jgi:hypothetical protein
MKSSKCESLGAGCKVGDVTESQMMVLIEPCCGCLPTHGEGRHNLLQKMCWQPRPLYSIGRSVLFKDTQHHDEAWA